MAQANARKHLLALAFIEHTSNNTPVSVQSYLWGDYIATNDNYPTNLQAAHNLVQEHMVTSSSSNSNRYRNNNCHVSLAQGSSGNRLSLYCPSAEYPCCICQSPDHWARECPNNQNASPTVSYARILSIIQNSGLKLSKNLIQDSCSVILIFNNRSLLVKVMHHCKWGLNFGVMIVLNGGTMDVEELGRLDGLAFPVWFKHD